LLAALSASRNTVIMPLTCFALETAMRLSEMLQIRWEHIAFDQRLVELPMTKNGKPRHVPLSGPAIAILKKRRAENLGPFRSTPSAIKQAWRRSIQRAALEDLHFHDLRHEAVSRLFERGLSLPEVALISGHSDPRMLMRYTHIQAAQISRKLA
jgi:integrase